MENNIVEDSLTYVSGAVGIYTGLSVDWILSLSISILTALFLAISIIVKLWKWHRDAKKDGKITAEELEQLKQIGIESVDDISQLIGKIKELSEDEKK